MSKFAIGERVEKTADDYEDGIVMAVFLTVDGDFRYAVDMEKYGALQFFTEENLWSLENLWSFIPMNRGSDDRTNRSR